MPNLIKPWYVVGNNEKTRYIDSNPQLEQIRQKMLEEQGEEKGSSNLQSGEFVEGIQPESLLVRTPEDIYADANEEAQRMMAQAKQEAEKLLQDARSHAEQIKMQALEEGNREAKAVVEKEFENLKQQLKEDFSHRHEELEQEYTEKRAVMEQELVAAFLSVFDKVFGLRISEDKDVLCRLVENTLLNIETGKHFQIHVSPADYERLCGREEDIRRDIGKSIELEIISDPMLVEGQCEIESDYGMFQCGIDVQYENLVKKIRALSI